MSDTEHERYTQQTVAVIDDYLEGKISATRAADWALRLVIARDFERLFDRRLRYALYLILDLHDEGKTWCPTKQDLKDCKRILLDKSIELPPFVEVKLKSKTKRGALKELRTLVRKRFDSKEKGGCEKPV